MIRSFNSKLTRRSFLTVSAFSACVLYQKVGNSQDSHLERIFDAEKNSDLKRIFDAEKNSNLERIFDAGKNMALALLPESVKDRITYQKSAVIQAETVNAVDDLEVGGERVFDHVTDEWANYGTGDRNHVSKCPTCNCIASRSLGAVGLVQYVPQLIVPDCFTIEYPTAVFAVTV